MINKLHFFQKIFIGILFCVSTPNLVLAQQQFVTLAYLENGLKELKNNEKQVALQLLANELIIDSGLQMNVIPMRTFSEMQESIEDGDIDYVIFNSFHFLSHYDFLQDYFVAPLLAIKRGPSDRENFIIVANKQYADMDLNSLRNKTLSLHPQYLLMKFYLAYLIKQSSGLDYKQFFNKIKHTKTASQAVLDVYFGISDLCIIPKHIFDLTVDLNPAIMKKLVILHQSEEQFFPVLVFSFKHLDGSVRNLINRNLSELNQSVRGEQILDMFNIQSINPVTLEQLQPMRILFQNYQTLSQK
ncbi:MAG: phosphate/phosphite/phosphonate ABC transporter substrate-binding protein [Methylococcaceae bacterium]